MGQVTIYLDNETQDRARPYEAIRARRSAHPSPIGNIHGARSKAPKKM